MLRLPEPKHVSEEATSRKQNDTLNWQRGENRGGNESDAVILQAEDFDKIVEAALARIPAPFRKRMANVAIVVEQEPPRPGLLGLYHGVPLTERSVSEGFRMPDQITIYQGPHERIARDRQQLEQMVADTVWHEIAHFFGMNEGEVRRSERRRRTKIDQSGRR